MKRILCLLSPLSSCAPLFSQNDNKSIVVLVSCDNMPEEQSLLPFSSIKTYFPLRFYVRLFQLNILYYAKYLATPLFFILINFSLFSQNIQDKKIIAVLSASKDIPSGVSLSPMVNQFIDALLQSTERQYRVVDRSEEFRRFIEQERDYQASGVVDKAQMARISKELGAKYVCVLYVEYSPNDKDYYFQSRILDVENNDIIGNADYPNEIEGEKNHKFRKTQLSRSGFVFNTKTWIHVGKTTRTLESKD